MTALLDQARSRHRLVLAAFSLPTGRVMGNRAVANGARLKPFPAPLRTALETLRASVLTR